MNPALITYHDVRQKDIAHISKPTHEHFAATYGLDLVAEKDDTVNQDCYMKKVYLTLRELEAGRPFVIWSDVDLMFRHDLDPKFIETYSKRDMMMSTEPMGPVDCFYMAKNTDMVKKLFRMWLDLGYAKNVKHEQETFLILYRNFPKITSMVTLIPQNVIGSQFIKGGTIGQHFYARLTPLAVIQGMMFAYRRETFDTFNPP